MRVDYWDASVVDFSLWTGVMNRAGENILLHWEVRPYKSKTNAYMPIPKPAVYKFDKSWTVSILRLRKGGKVSRLHGSSDIQSGLQRDQTSPPRIYRAAEE